jgi:hypothetical protein
VDKYAAAGQLGGLTRWAKEPDRQTQPRIANTAFMERFEREARELAPDATDEIIAKMADAAKRLYFARLAHRSVKARRAAARAAAAEGEAP